jgi:hypothetical protein
MKLLCSHFQKAEAIGRPKYFLKIHHSSFCRNVMRLFFFLRSGRPVPDAQADLSPHYIWRNERPPSAHYRQPPSPYLSVSTYDPNLGLKPPTPVSSGSFSAPKRNPLSVDSLLPSKSLPSPGEKEHPRLSRKDDFVGYYPPHGNVSVSEHDSPSCFIPRTMNMNMGAVPRPPFFL